MLLLWWGLLLLLRLEGRNGGLRSCGGGRARCGRHADHRVRGLVLVYRGWGRLLLLLLLVLLL